MRSDWVGADMGAIYSIVQSAWLLFYIDNMVKLGICARAIEPRWPLDVKARTLVSSEAH